MLSPVRVSGRVGRLAKAGCMASMPNCHSGVAVAGLSSEPIAMAMCFESSSAIASGVPQVEQKYRETIDDDLNMPGLPRDQRKFSRAVLTNAAK